MKYLLITLCRAFAVQAPDSKYGGCLVAGGRKGMRETYRVRPTVLVRCVLWCVLDETPVVVVREFAKGAKSVD